MALSETQLKCWRLHRRRGEAYPYYNNLAASALVTPYSTLNVSPYLPAGTLIDIGTNHTLYVTRNSLRSGEWGEMDPLNWNPSYIMPKKSSDTFADRASVYWDETNCYATSSSSGNQFLGYAVSNKDLGTATNGTSASLTTASGSGASTITGGTSADGQVGAYQSTDVYVEVEVIQFASVTVSQLGQATNIIADPGTAASIVVTQGGTCELTIAAAGETRGLPVPTFDGQRMGINIKGFTASATVKIALGAAYNGTPSTTIDGTNKFASMSAFGQGVLLEAIPASATTWVWKLIANLGSTLAAS